MGGNSRDANFFIIAAEMIHVGSLIIDDFQDESLLRRGGPTVHIEYGPALAINVGCSAYFNIHQLTQRLKVCGCVGVWVCGCVGVACDLQRAERCVCCVMGGGGWGLWGSWWLAD